MLPYRLCAFAFLTTISAGCATTLDGGNASWKEVRSPHFSLYTDGSSEVARERLIELERFRSFVGSISSMKLREDLPRFVVVAPRSLMPYETLNLGRKGVIGYYTSNRRGAAAVFSLSARNHFESLKIAFHEYVHHVQARSGAGAMPFWYREGLAEFLSGVTVEPSGDLTFHGVVGLRVVDLKHRDWLPLKDVVEGRIREAERPMAYAQAWLLIHYLVNERPQAFTAIKSELAKHPDRSTPAILDALKTDYSTLSYRLGKYLRRGTFDTFRMASTRVSPPTTVHPVPTEERDLFLASLGLQRLELARVRALAGRQPPDALIQLALIEKLEMEDELDEALKRTEAFLRRRPDVPRALACRASLLFKKAVHTEPTSLRHDALSEALEAALAANRANPDDVVPFEVLASIGAAGGPLGQKNVIMAFETARVLAPHRRELLLLEAGYRFDQGDTRVARAIAQRLTTNAEDKRIRSAASELLSKIDMSQ